MPENLSDRPFTRTSSATSPRQACNRLLGSGHSKLVRRTIELPRISEEVTITILHTPKQENGDVHRFAAKIDRSYLLCRRAGVSAQSSPGAFHGSNRSGNSAQDHAGKPGPGSRPSP